MEISRSCNCSVNDLKVKPTLENHSYIDFSFSNRRVFHRRFIRTQQPTSGNASVAASRRKYQMKLVRMIAMSIAAFVLSWSPYCVVSIIATIRGTNVLTPGEAEIPDLLAKASVIYNPIVYTVMNDRFRATLLRIIPCSRFSSREINPADSVSRSAGSLGGENANPSAERRRSQKYESEK